jgi:hypothetical protein
MKKTFFAYMLFGAGLISCFLLLPTSANTFSAASISMVSGVPVANNAPIVVQVYVITDFLPCKQVREIGVVVEDVRTNRELSNYRNTYTMPLSGRGVDAKRDFSIAVSNLDSGDYRIRPIVTDTCGNSTMGDQGNEILFKVPEIFTIKIIQPKIELDLSTENSLMINVSYDQSVAIAKIQSKKFEVVNFFSSSLSPNVFNCSNIKPKQKGVITVAANLSYTPNCSFRIDPFQGTYEYVFTPKGLPIGTHDLQISMQDPSGKETTKLVTKMWVPKIATTSIEFTSPSIADPIGKKDFAVNLVADPKSTVSVRELTIQISGVGLSSDLKDSDGNSYLLPYFTGEMLPGIGISTWKVTEGKSFKFSLNTSIMPNGYYTITATNKDSAGTVSTAQIPIIVQNEKTITSIEFPSASSNVISGINDFAVNSVTDPKSSILIKELSLQIIGVDFNPVAKTIGEKNPYLVANFNGKMQMDKGAITWSSLKGKSFKFSLDTSSWPNGQYRFAAAVKDSTGAISMSEKSISVQNSGPIIDNSSIQLPSGDVSESLRIGFSAANQSNSSSKIQIVKVIKNGKPTTDGLIAEFPNQGMRNGGWMVNGLTKFSWRLSFADIDNIIYDKQDGFWSVPIADDPEKESQIKTSISFSLEDNFGKTSTANLTSPVLITCKICETKIIKELKNIRAINKYKKLSNSDLEQIKSSLSESKDIRQKILELIRTGESTLSDVNKEFKGFSTGVWYPKPWKGRIIKTKITQKYWERSCSNPALKLEGERLINSATSSRNQSFGSLESLKRQLGEIDGIILANQEYLDESTAKVNGLNDLSKSEKVSNSQVLDGEKLKDEISDLSEKSKNKLKDARSVKSTSDMNYSKIDQVKAIKELKDKFFSSAIACDSKEPPLKDTAGSIDGDSSSTTPGETITILCVNKKTGKEPEKVSGKAPKCPKGKVEKKFKK